MTRRSVDRFVCWLEKYGEESYDHQTYYASKLGGRAKALYYKRPILGTLAVAPLVFSEAFLPSLRRLFWHPRRLPIADAHYAMGFAFLYQITRDGRHYEKALHFLEVLERTKCSGFKYFGWGYPFDWVTREGTIPAGTPLITTTPYVYEAFLQVYRIDRNDKWLEILRSIAEHAARDIKDFRISDNASACSYNPYDGGGVINASAYRAFLLMNASNLFSDSGYREIAERNLNFVLQSQRPDGSWYYAIDGVRDFIDHFHTCFVLKALAKIEQMGGHKGCTEAIEKGIRFYLENLFDDNGLPRPFARAPRLTVYRHELYDYAECINLGVLLKNRFRQLDNTLIKVIDDLTRRWQKVDGAFRSRKLIFGWDNVPMHRWALSQTFRSLCFFLYQAQQEKSKLAPPDC